MPAASSSARAGTANASRPTAPNIATSAPARRAASAWFAPLPPGLVAKLEPWSVSPGRGRRATRATRSRLIEPKTMTTCSVPVAAVAVALDEALDEQDVAVGTELAGADDRERVPRLVVERVAGQVTDLAVGQRVLGQHGGEVGDRRRDGVRVADHLHRERRGHRDRVERQHRRAQRRAPTARWRRRCRSPSGRWSAAGKLASTMAMVSPWPIDASACSRSAVRSGWIPFSMEFSAAFWRRHCVFAPQGSACGVHFRTPPAGSTRCGRAVCSVGRG